MPQNRRCLSTVFLTALFLAVLTLGQPLHAQQEALEPAELVVTPSELTLAIGESTKLEARVKLIANQEPGTN